MTRLRLRVSARNRTERCEVIAGDVVVGVDPGCDVVIDHPSVAPRHARLLSRRGRLILSSIGGPQTSVQWRGDKLRAPVMLTEGETFWLGDVALQAWQAPRLGPPEPWPGPEILGPERDQPEPDVRRWSFASGSELVVANETSSDWAKRLVGSSDSGHLAEALGPYAWPDGVGFIERLPPGVRLERVLSALNAVPLTSAAAAVVVAHAMQGLAAFHRDYGAHGAFGPHAIHLSLNGKVLVVRPGPRGRFAQNDMYLAPERRYGSGVSKAADMYALARVAVALPIPDTLADLLAPLARADSGRRPQELHRVADQVRDRVFATGFDPAPRAVAHVARVLWVPPERALVKTPSAHNPMPTSVKSV